MFIPKMEEAGDFLYLIRQGFIAAYLNHSGYYYIIQEMELNGGYCDLTMIPDLTRFPEVAHAYLLELKYLKTAIPMKKETRPWKKQGLSWSNMRKTQDCHS